MNYHKVYMNHVHSSSLLTQLATMWKSQTLCDAVIRTGNIITKAHRVVLVAACPMLQSMENATSGSHLEVRLASDIKQDSINTFLQYLYEGFMILTEENCKDVEKIARLLQVDGVIKCCLDFTKCLNASSSMQFKYSFHDQTEFKHVRVSELLKVQEKQHKRPSESSRPSSPGSKRQRILRASSPPLDTAMQVGAQKTHDTERMTESYKNNASDPWERVPRLGSQGASSQGANLQPGVIDIREDSLELIQTEPPKDSGGGRSQEPRKVQSSVSISVASQHNTNADLRVINVDGSNDSSSKTPVSTSSARGQITVSPLTMYHDSPTSSSSSVDSSRLPSERLPVSVPPSKPSSDHERQIPPSVNLSDFPTPSGDSLSHVKQRSSESFTTSTPHRAPYPVSLSAASRPAPSSQIKPFAAGSASQAGMSHSFTEGMPSSGPRSQQPPVSSSVGKSDGVEGSTTEKSSDISSKPKPDETPSTSDMTPDISIVKVEAGGDTDVPENLGGLDMYVTAGGVSVTSQQQVRPPEDEEMDPADFDLEEPPGDWSRDEISNEGSSISGDQSGSWYTGQFKDTSTGAEECEPKAGIYTSDVALRYKMIELIPGVPVYVHQYQYDKALDKIKINQKTGQHDGTPAARYLLGVFYTKTELVNATNRNIDAETKSSFVPLNKTILYAIEVFCQMHSSSTLGRIKAAISNKITSGRIYFIKQKYKQSSVYQY